MLLYAIYSLAEARGLGRHITKISHPIPETYSVSFECSGKYSKGMEAWQSPQSPFNMIHEGARSGRMLEYDGELFADDIDALETINRRLALALTDLMLSDARRCLPSDFGVRVARLLQQSSVEYRVQ
jgi:hypothetical protein